MPEPTCQVDSPLSAMEMALSSRAAQLPAVSVASQMEWVFMNNTGKAFACNIYTSWPIRGEKYVCVPFFFFFLRKEYRHWSLRVTAYFAEHISLVSSIAFSVFLFFGRIYIQPLVARFYVAYVLILALGRKVGKTKIKQILCPYDQATGSRFS